MALTEEEILQLNVWLQEASVVNMPLEQPVTASVAFLDDSPMHGGSLLGGAPKLSETTKRRYAQKKGKEIARRKTLAEARKRYQKGSRHHRSKEATRRRQAEKRWKEQPYKSLVYGKGLWNITEEEWNLKIGWLWKEHCPLDLVVKRRWGYGTKDRPYTVYDLKVVDEEAGIVLYDGDRQWLYDISEPNALDIEKAPEGACLFT